jgi:hypothetical protein
MKLTTDRPSADPEKAARRLMDHASAFEPVQDGRVYIEHLNAPFLFGDRGTPAENAEVLPTSGNYFSFIWCPIRAARR